MSSSPSPSPREPPWWVELLVAFSGGWPETMVIAVIAVAVGLATDSAIAGVAAGLMFAEGVKRLVIRPALRRAGWTYQSSRL